MVEANLDKSPSPRPVDPATTDQKFGFGCKIVDRNIAYYATPKVDNGNFRECSKAITDTLQSAIGETAILSAIIVTLDGVETCTIRTAETLEETTKACFAWAIVTSAKTTLPPGSNAHTLRLQPLARVEPCLLYRFEILIHLPF